VKYAILSDVHANLQALEAVLADARRMGAETFVSLGDSVGYGPLPAEAVARICETCTITLAGNHDDAVSGRMDAKDFNGLAADAVQRHREALKSDQLDWLRSLPYTEGIEGAWCAHGDLVDPPKFFYIEDEADASANFSGFNFTLAFVGHTHEPGVFLTGQSGTVYKTEPQDFTLEDGKRYIVNPGSVGYPREANGVCRSSYVIYDSTARTVEFRFIPFSVASVMQRGRGPKTRGKLLAGLGAALLVALGLCVTLATGSGPKDDPALVLDTRTLALGPETRELHANLKLAKDSVPVNLRLRFLASDNGLLTEHTITVQQSSKKNLLDRNLTVPAEAKLVTLTVLKTKAADAARIDRFEPNARE